MPLISPSPCPNCHVVLDGSTGVGHGPRIDDAAVPEPGDATICIRCGHICIYGDNLVLRDPTSDEMHDLAGDERILAISRAIAKTREP